MQLLSLELNDFQAHKHLIVEFGKGITTIQGPTDSGKSAVLRALRWVCQNDIAGDDFIREGAKLTEVALKIEHDKKRYTILRRKGLNGSLNEYHLNGDVFKSFNNGVPEPIAKLLNLNDINFQGQHDSPYWFAETAGEVSRRLNAIIDLSVIDTALSNVAAEVRKSQERKAIIEERLAETKTEYEKLAPQQERIKEFTVLRQYHEKFTGLEADVNRIRSVIERLRANRERAVTAKQKYEEGEMVFGLAREAVKWARGHSNLSAVIEAVQHNRGKAEPPPSFAAVETSYQDYLEVADSVDTLSGLIDTIEKATANVFNQRRWADECLQKYRQKTKGQICPTCNQPLQLR